MIYTTVIAAETAKEKENSMSSRTTGIVIGAIGGAFVTGIAVLIAKQLGSKGNDSEGYRQGFVRAVDKVTQEAEEVIRIITQESTKNTMVNL